MRETARICPERVPGTHCVVYLAVSSGVLSREGAYVPIFLDPGDLKGCL